MPHPAFNPLVWFISLALWWIPIGAFAEECPQGARSCKIMTLTPEEEQTLLAPNAIFDAAVYANRMQFEQLTKAWREKISAAPAGTIPAPPAKPEK